MKDKPVILIILGASGDLVERYILPGIVSLTNKKKLPKKFKVISITSKSNFKRNITKYEEIYSMDINNTKEYKGLIQKIHTQEEIWQEKADILFYLSLPPIISTKIIKKIGQNSFFKEKKIKLLLEKPFGTDLKNAKKQLTVIQKYFKESQIYRVDHYLFKKIISKIETFKNKNKITNESIMSIEVNALEEIGIGKRINFYEKVGAIKDMIQSHLLEFASIVLKDDKTDFSQNQARYKVLKNLELVKEKTKKGQYEGYIDAKINPGSNTETFASITLKSKNINLNKIKITLNTGKALAKKETFIKIQYQNKKIVLIKEKIDKKHNSYEGVILNAINSKKDYFISQKEVLESWRIIDPVIKISKKHVKNLIIYKQGIKLENVLKITN